MTGDAVRRLMDLYPKIFFACHTQHVQDPTTRRVVSSHQASILDHLDDEEPTTVGELARHMGVTPSTMSLGLDRLERKGYVRRTRDPHDARRVGLTLTASGARLRDAQSVLDPERVRAMLNHLADDDRERALGGLALLADAGQREMHRKQLYGLRNRTKSSTRRGT